MTQYDFGALSPADSGPTLAAKLSGVIPALLTNHKGPTRPSYTQPGMLWINDAGATWLLNLFDGDEDVTIAGINPATHQLQTTGVPTSRKVKTGAAFLLNGVAGTDEEPAEADLAADLLIKLIFASTAATIEGAREDLPVHPAGLKAAIAALAPNRGYTDVSYVNASGNFAFPDDLDTSLDPLVFVFGAGGGSSSGSFIGGFGGLAVGTVAAAASEVAAATVGASVLTGTAGSSSFKGLSATGGGAATSSASGADGVGSGGNIENNVSQRAQPQGLNYPAQRELSFALAGLTMAKRAAFTSGNFLLNFSVSYAAQTPWMPNSGDAPGARVLGQANRYGAGGAVIIFYKRKGA